jgi:hypothetical protein
VGPTKITLRLRETVREKAPELEDDSTAERENVPEAAVADGTTVVIPRTQPAPPAAKGIVHVPAHGTPTKAGQREAVLIVIAKARTWMQDLANSRAANFAAIARREGKTEKHVRLLAPLAFLSPRIVSALLDGTAPADLTVRSLTQSLPYSWAQQEERVGLGQAAAGNAARCSSTVSKISPEEASTATLPV